MKSLLLGALLFSCATTAPLPPPSGSLDVGKELQLKLPLYPDGQPHDLAADRGSVVLIDVWASWCEPCKDTLPLYQQLAKDFGRQGLRVYALNEDQDVKQVKKFIAAQKLTLPVLLDPGSTAAEQKLNVKIMPTTFLIDRAGRIRKVHEGALDNISALYEMYKSELLPMLAEPAP